MEGELISKREVYEAQKPEVLIAHRAKLLGKLSLIESEIFLLNDVIDGYGYTRCDPGAAYDANDGTLGSPEHPEDEQWIVRGTE